MMTRYLKNPGASADSVELARSADIKISGCPNSCGQHHVAAIGFHGTMRHAGDGRQIPEYQLHLGGGFNEDGVQFGRHIVKIPAQRSGEALLEVTARLQLSAPGQLTTSWIVFEPASASPISCKRVNRCGRALVRIQRTIRFWLLAMSWVMCFCWDWP